MILHVTRTALCGSHIPFETSSSVLALEARSIGTRSTALEGKTKARKMGTRRKAGVVRNGRKCLNSRSTTIEIERKANIAKELEPAEEAILLLSWWSCRTSSSWGFHHDSRAYASAHRLSSGCCLDSWVKEKKGVVVKLLPDCSFGRLVQDTSVGALQSTASQGLRVKGAWMEGRVTCLRDTGGLDGVTDLVLEHARSTPKLMCKYLQGT